MALAFLILALVQESQAGILTNGSFENGAWDGSQTFVTPGNATTVQPDTLDDWMANGGSAWIQDPMRAADGSRFLWLGPPATTADTFASFVLPVASAGDASQQLVAGHDYRLTAGYSFFDPSDPAASNLGAKSSFQVYYLLGNYSPSGDPLHPLLADDASTHTDLLSVIGSVSSWDDGFGGSGLDWRQADLSWSMPDITGFDYLHLYLAAPEAGVLPSRGVLVDHAVLSVVAVPEPASLILSAAGLAMLLRRRGPFGDSVLANGRGFV